MWRCSQDAIVGNSSDSLSVSTVQEALSQLLPLGFLCCQWMVCVWGDSSSKTEFLHLVRWIAPWKCLLFFDKEGYADNISLPSPVFKICGRSGYLQSFRFISIGKLSRDPLLAWKQGNGQNISRVNKNYNSVLKNMPAMLFCRFYGAWVWKVKLLLAEMKLLIQRTLGLQ